MGRIKQAVHNLTIKKTFMLYMLVFLLLAAGLSSITISLASSVKNRINLSYQGSANKYSLGNGAGVVVFAAGHIEYSEKDKVVINICSLIEIWSIPVFFGVNIMLSALLFYRNKLKRPIELLGEASEQIAGNDLNFHISYDSKDEMGQLCVSFETMRAALESNNREMWRAIEERRRLNTAFSHDLRTPLTVLRGYVDFLKNYAPQGKISREKLISTISTMSEHISRLEDYVRVMSDVQKLEDISPSFSHVEVYSLFEQFKSTAEVLVKDTSIKVEFINEIPEQEICLDSSVVIRVYENLVSNAVRYAEGIISVECRYIDGRLYIVLSDDGKGFTEEDLKNADKPYYRNHSNTDESHFGMGLTICRILCEKHRGSLLIENGKNGGARLTASFLCS